MTKFQRIENFIVAIFLLVLSVILIFVQDDGYLVVFGLINISWFIQSLRLLVYYFTMARFMVGGKRVLLKGVIFFDLALVSYSLSDIPKIYIMLYLVSGMLFINLIELLRAIDAKKCGNPHWILKMSEGIVGMAMAVICLMNYKSPTLIVYIYAVELAYAALVRIVNTFRRTSMVYIQ